MTHPIPGADSERECRKTCDVCFDEVGQEWPCARMKAHAAAKVGANVAAEGILVLNEQGNAWPIRRRADGNWEFADNGFGHYPALAAGAPAETPKPVAVELIGVAEQIEQGAGFWHSCSGCHDTEDGHPTGNYAYSNEMRCALGNGCAECGGLGAVWDNNDYSEAAGDFLFAQPAPIAGDVEKDAAMREAVRDAVAENLRGLYYCGRVWSAWSVGTMGEDDFAPAEEDEDIISNITDAAIAAMLANSSSGEAG